MMSRTRVDSPDLYEAVRAKFLEKDKQRNTGGASRLTAATAGAAAAGAVTGVRVWRAQPTSSRERSGQLGE
jgi:hypothetical protein